MSEQFDSSRPIYAQLVEQLKARDLAGTYQSGGHLDSVRDLAAAAGVNPNTMQRALAQLEAEGLVRTERTSGRFVTEDIDLIEQLRASAARNMCQQIFWKRCAASAIRPSRRQSCCAAGTKRRENSMSKVLTCEHLTKAYGEREDRPERHRPEP